jgi:Flp pilus assembly pilin Flp
MSTKMRTYFMQALLILRTDKRAVTIIEYALLAALIGLALVTSLTGLTTKISTVFTNIGTDL